MSIEEQPLQKEFTSEAVQRFLDIVQQYMASAELEQILRTLHLVQVNSWGGISSVGLIQRSLDLATILARMHIDAIGVSAGLVFEIVNTEKLSLESVESIIGSKIVQVIDSVRELNALAHKLHMGAILAASPTNDGVDNNLEQKNHNVRAIISLQRAEKVRKMLLAMAKTPHAVILKLAYQLHTMRMKHAASNAADQQELLTIARDTREIYGPLAGRLGLSPIQSELEDLAFEILEPKAYLWVRSQIEMESKQWSLYVDRVCKILRNELAQIGLKAEVSGRVKHLYSFYKKLQRLAGNTERLEDLQYASSNGLIRDLLAFRILVESVPDCYIALGHVHSLWKPEDGHFKDFIANPKPNGYSALHTTVLCLDDQFVEIQIRTFAMHQTAEYGVAMYWHSKEATSDTSALNKKELLAWLRKLADWQRELQSPSTSEDEFGDAVSDNLRQEQIFVFTPKGDVIDLPSGSTPLDFAYRIHSEVGDSYAGARIVTEEGGRLVKRMVAMDYELKSGETVEIVTNRTARPTRDWLDFVRTSTARSKIHHYLRIHEQGTGTQTGGSHFGREPKALAPGTTNTRRKSHHQRKVHERDIVIQIGHERLERELKALSSGIAMRHSIAALGKDLQNWLASEYGQASFEDLLAALGSDNVHQHDVALKIMNRVQQLREERDGKEVEGLLARLQVGGASGLLTILANCCYPLPGDTIVGFVSRGKGTIVHRADCKNVKRDSERLIDVNWNSLEQQHYLAPITIMARNRSGLFRDIATIISGAGAYITSVSSHVNNQRGLMVINAILWIDGLKQLHRLFTRLERLKDVVAVDRDLG